MSTPVNKNEGESYGAFVRRQFRKNSFGMVSVWIVGIVAVIAIFADLLANDKPVVCSLRGEVYFPVVREMGVTFGIAQWGTEFATADWKALNYDWAVYPLVPYAPSSTDKQLVTLKERAPSGSHWLGTDDIGRDVLSGLIHGSRYALSIGFVAMSIALTIVALVEEGTLWLIMGLIGLTGWTSIARFMRGEVLRVRNLDYVSAATALGYSTTRIIFRHVMPNAIAPVLIYAAFGIVSAILFESALSFLGFGVPPTVVTWGSVLHKARASTYSWWLAVFPGLMIFVTVSAFNLIGDALRDATDPRLRN